MSPSSSAVRHFICLLALCLAFPATLAFAQPEADSSATPTAVEPAPAATETAATTPDPARFEDAIAAFEAQDAESPPPEEAVLFVGSSSIRMWNLSHYFRDLKTINRGFGGAHVSDVVHFADRIVTPYAPAAIVFYAGDNDIAEGKSPDEVFEDFRQFLEIVRRDLPDTPVFFIGIKPSIKRWNMVTPMRAVNRRVRELSRQDDQLTYIDVDDEMLGEDFRPNERLFLFDGLHLSPEGYALWTQLLAPHLRRIRAAQKTNS